MWSCSYLFLGGRCHIHHSANNAICIVVCSPLKTFYFILLCNIHSQNCDSFLPIFWSFLVFFFFFIIKQFLNPKNCIRFRMMTGGRGCCYAMYNNYIKIPNNQLHARIIIHFCNMLSWLSYMLIKFHVMKCDSFLSATSNWSYRDGSSNRRKHSGISSFAVYPVNIH